MTRKKPTRGEREAAKYAKKMTACGVPMLVDTSLARSIDRAIKAAVKDERVRCMKVVFDQMLRYTPDGAAAALLRTVGTHIKSGEKKPAKGRK